MRTIYCKYLIILWVLAILPIWPSGVRAKAPQVVSYALVIGSNRPGEGQSALSFALDDANRFEKVLLEIGGYMPGRVTVLHDPSAEELVSALNAISDKIAGHDSRDEPTSFVFYYSGHARATAMNLGATEIKLKSLRSLLEKVPARFKLVVLDACQTGAISTVKGVEPARDFSYNSVNGLQVEGMAVLASSAADELSQESSTLRGSFFTHHLVTGLRGAADVDGDGRVTLQEAHKYTYNRTLVDTAKTAVGKQHVTFETEMSGEGEMVLTWPSDAEARLLLPGKLDGEVLVYKEPDQAVMAEIHKVSEEVVTLALKSGEYRTLVRRGGAAYQCEVSLKRGGTASIALETCRTVPIETFSPKGERTRREHLFFEIGFGTMIKFKDRYVERLSDFDYRNREVLERTSIHWRFSVFASIIRYLQAGVSFGRLDDGYFDTEDNKSFEWHAYRLGVRLRGRLPLAGDHLVPYVEAGGGLAFGVTDYTDEGRDSVSDHERFFRYHVGGGLGVQAMPWTHVGFYLQGDFDYAPVISNLVGDTHNSGGISMAMGMRGGF